MRQYNWRMQPCASAKNIKPAYTNIEFVNYCKWSANETQSFLRYQFNIDRCVNENNIFLSDDQRLIGNKLDGLFLPTDYGRLAAEKKTVR